MAPKNQVLASSAFTNSSQLIWGPDTFKYIYYKRSKLLGTRNHDKKFTKFSQTSYWWFALDVAKIRIMQISSDRSQILLWSVKCYAMLLYQISRHLGQRLRIYNSKKFKHFLFHSWWSEGKISRERSCQSVSLLNHLNQGLSPRNSCNVFSIKFAVIWVIAELCTVCQTKVTTKTKQSGIFQEFLWRSPLFQLFFLVTRLTKELSFD